MQKHTWVEEYSSFEAVLHCANVVTEWDAAATLRAYQTYGFDDATTSGNDQSFRHIDTGVLLLHEGGVVAIQFGDGSLTSALSDLFLVLHALGWKAAEVYHPPETIGALLHDMGSAIPAHLDFDVRAAVDTDDTSRLPPEADEMVQLGTSLMKTVATTPEERRNFQALALQELDSMSPDQAGQPINTGELPQALPAAGAVHLDDDLGEDWDEPGHIQSPPGRPIFVDDLDAQPVIPVIGRAVYTSESPSGMIRHDVDELASNESPVYSKGSEVPTVVHEPAPLPAPSKTELQEAASPLERKVHEQLAGSTTGEQAPVSQHGDGVGDVGAHIGALIRVGNSALSFDLPDTAMSMGDIDRFVADIGAQEVVHVWPGLVNQSERWDLIGEIDPRAPWFAEVVASVMEVQKPIERVWLASALVQMAKHQKGAQLRDLLINLHDTESFNGANTSFRFSKNEDFENYMSSVQSSFGGLLLSENGEAFLDIKAAEGVIVRPFSVRSMIESHESKLYVIHLDAVDGPFVEMTINLLMTVAHRYSISTRARTQAQAVLHELERRRESDQREAEKAHLAKVEEATGKIRELLKAVGLSAADLALPA